MTRHEDFKVGDAVNFSKLPRRRREYDTKYQAVIDRLKTTKIGFAVPITIAGNPSGEDLRALRDRLAAAVRRAHKDVQDRRYSLRMLTNGVAIEVKAPKTPKADVTPEKAKAPRRRS